MSDRQNRCWRSECYWSCYYPAVCPIEPSVQNTCTHGAPEGECASCAACAACSGECEACPYVEAGEPR